MIYRIWCRECSFRDRIDEPSPAAVKTYLDVTEQHSHGGAIVMRKERPDEEPRSVPPTIGIRQGRRGRTDRAESSVRRRGGR